MKISTHLADKAILIELGARLARQRIERNLTQAQLAERAGIAKRTLERIEAGGASQLLNLVRVCRALDLVENINVLVPEPVPSPLALLKLKGKERQRASQTKTTALSARQPWQWNDKPVPATAALTTAHDTAKK